MNPSTADLTFEAPFKVRHQDRQQPQACIWNPGRVPRISRLVALAIHFDGLIRSGAVRDYAELARLGHVSRTRVTQIMSLLQLAPDIQEELLHLPRTVSGRDATTERHIRPLLALVNWKAQRESR